MKIPTVLALLFLPLVAAASGGAAGQAATSSKPSAQNPARQPDPNAAFYLRDVLPILMGKCARCHNEQTRFLQDWLQYDNAAAKRWEIKRRVWDSWHGAYFKQPMPTANSPESEGMTEAERLVIKNWVEQGAQLGAAPIYSGGDTKAERLELGKRLFTSVCAACHQMTGQGLPGRFPPLAGSDFLNSDKHRAIGILLNGLQGEVTVNGRAFNNSMPKFPLSDQQIASALTFVYNSFGNSGQDVTPAEVAAVRAEKPGSGAAGQNQVARTPQEKSPFE